MDIELIRNPDQTVETQGKIIIDPIHSFDTLELAWKDNKNGLSCIPVGKYNWVKVDPTAKIPYPHISIAPVPGRDGICIHSANFAAQAPYKTVNNVKLINTDHVQLLGCITVGQGYLDINGDGILDIINSKISLGKLMDLLPDSGTITISNAQILS
jgi:hypothetical protein